MSHFKWLGHTEGRYPSQWCPGLAAYLPFNLSAVICLFSQACCRDCYSPLLLLLCPEYQDSRSQPSKPSSLPMGHHGDQTPLPPVRSLHLGSGAEVTAQCFLDGMFPPDRKQQGSLQTVLLNQQARESAISWSWEATLPHVVLHQPRPDCAPCPACLCCSPSGPPSVATCPSATVPIPATNPLLSLLPHCPSSKGRLGIGVA